MRKRNVFVLAAALAAAVLVLVLWKDESAPQIITLPNGSQYEFIAAEWGTNLIQPTRAARFVARLPNPLANFIRQKYGNRLGIVTWVDSGAVLLVSATGTIQLRPPEPAMHFWFRSLSTNTAGRSPFDSLKFVVADQDGIVAGRGSSSWLGISYGGDMWQTFGQGKNGWLKFTLPVVPRRCETLQLFLLQANEVIGTVRFRNPLFGHFPSWQPEALPATKSSGDVKVRLSDFSVGVMNPWDKVVTVEGRQTQVRPPHPGEDAKVVFKLDISSPRGTNETWLVTQPELSDATGNRIRHASLTQSHVTGEYSFGPALWPDETAWRLKLTLKRSRGFAPEELVTFTNVPVPLVGATNLSFLTNRIQGAAVVLKQLFVRNPDVVTNAGKGWMAPTDVSVEIIDPPEGVVVGFERLITVSGWMPPQWGGGSGPTGSASIHLNSVPTNVTTLSFTWAVQKMRTVEFLVNPPQPK